MPGGCLGKDCGGWGLWGRDDGNFGRLSRGPFDERIPDHQPHRHHAQFDPGVSTGSTLAVTAK